MELKIPILLLCFTLAILVFAFMLISNAMGNIFNVLSRLEEIIRKEGVIKTRKKVKEEETVKKDSLGEKLKQSKTAPSAKDASPKSPPKQ